MSDNNIENKDPVILKKETFLGITRIGHLIVMLIASLIIVTSVVAVVLAIRVSENQKELNYICSTTKILDDLVVAAGSQIKLNLDNGSYTRLERQGILTPANIQAARDALVQYDRAHTILHNNGACKIK